MNTATFRTNSLLLIAFTALPLQAYPGDFPDSISGYTPSVPAHEQKPEISQNAQKILDLYYEFRTTKMKYSLEFLHNPTDEEWVVKKLSELLSSYNQFISQVEANEALYPQLRQAYQYESRQRNSRWNALLGQEYYHLIARRDAMCNFFTPPFYNPSQAYDEVYYELEGRMAHFVNFLIGASMRPKGIAPVVRPMDMPL